MANPTLYKKESTSVVNNRTTSDLTTQEQSAVNSTITKFFELFAAKHL